MEQTPAGQQPLESIDSILDSFFASSCIGKQIPTCVRYLRVAAQLRAYLETEGHRILCPDDAALLDLERSLDPDLAFARLFGAEVLAYTLRGFLEPEWLLPDLQDRRTQVSLTPRLIQWLCNNHLLDPRRDRAAIHGTRAAAAWARRGPARGRRDGA
ncbi:hypothetical protein OL239_04530 [Arthrobacter sp. ATA002]|uniref:hypothetical protein n=1 Tax=Arthrobacter sp. ATA002 TaxID=2991715 RepID=UPI0022A794C3|nr:hypothetical protein [Arthrobacter sp. ATA002]WAP52520.1 hypothetical protein OL239_04530 [Arthrobacter sp. ATA002]